MRCPWYLKILIFGAFFYNIYNLFLLNEYPNSYSISPCYMLNPKNLLQTYQTYSQYQRPITLEPEPLNWIDVRVIAEPSKNDICNVKTLFVIHSSPEKVEDRAYLRNEIFDPAIKKGVSIAAFFVVGYTKDADLARESEQFKDLLLLDLEEHYHNITHKARAWINYIHEKCNEAIKNPEFIIKLDDDVSINLPGVLEVVKIFKPFKQAVFGRVYSNGQVVRNPRSKWHLSKSEFPGTSLGVYCQGMAFGFSFNLLPKMFRNLKRVQYLWMDDWYVTHALLYETQAIYFDLQSHYVSINTEEEYEKFVKNQPKKVLLFGHFRPKSRFPLKNRKSAWRQLQLLHSSCSSS